MSFDKLAREVEAAQANLLRSEADSSFWSDEQRRQFDTDRLAPLHRAADQLRAALLKADDQVKEVRSLLGRHD